jgi:putative transposase
MERRAQLIGGEFFHIYNRGIDRRKIFFTPRDYMQFLLRLFLCNQVAPVRVGDKCKSHISRGVPLRNLFDTRDTEPLVDIVAWCLMPNHFHMILKGREDWSISQFMEKFSTAYSMYMNIKYERSGPLMCRPFRAKHIDTDEYFRWVLAYVHLNPLDLVEKNWKEKGISNLRLAQKFLDEYPWSSYQDYYKTERPETKILSKEELPIAIQDMENIKRMMEEYQRGA